MASLQGVKMKSSNVRSSCLALSLVVGSALATAQTDTLYGLRFRADPDLEYCQDGDRALPPPAGNCVTEAKASRHAKLPFSGPARVRFAFGLLPLWIDSSEVHARFVDRKLVHATIYTRGIPHHEEVLAALTEKYGRPSGVTATTVQNRMGAKFESVEARWQIGDMRVDYVSSAGRIDRGLIVVSTPEGAAAEQEARKRTDEMLGGRIPM